MKAQLILTLLSAASVIAAPIAPRGQGKNVCKVHVGTQKHVTVLHTIYSSSAAPLSSAAPKKEESAPITTAPVAAAPVVTEAPAPPPATTAAPVSVAPPAPVTTAAPAVETFAPAAKKADNEAAPVVDNTAAAPATGGYEHVGEATFYDPDLGACGTSNSGSEMVAAISQSLFDLTTPNGNPNKNPVCGRKARCSVKGGKEFIVTIVDRCVGCAFGDIDLSPAAFRASGAQESEGRVKVEWSLV